MLKDVLLMCQPQWLSPTGDQVSGSSPPGPATFFRGDQNIFHGHEIFSMVIPSLLLIQEGVCVCVCVCGGGGGVLSVSGERM